METPPTQPETNPATQATKLPPATPTPADPAPPPADWTTSQTPATSSPGNGTPTKRGRGRPRKSDPKPAKPTKTPAQAQAAAAAILAEPIAPAPDKDLVTAQNPDLAGQTLLPFDPDAQAEIVTSIGEGLLALIDPDEPLTKAEKTACLSTCRAWFLERKTELVSGWVAAAAAWVAPLARRLGKPATQERIRKFITNNANQ